MSEIIIFRDLPGIQDIEQRYIMQLEQRLMKDEIEALENDVRTKSLELFGVTKEDTWRDPDGSVFDSSAEEWDQHFEFLYDWFDEEPDFWRAFGLDMMNEEGEPLVCILLFGRQLVCALRKLHPKASLNFRLGPLTPQQAEAAAEAWGRALMHRR